MKMLVLGFLRPERNFSSLGTLTASLVLFLSLGSSEASSHLDFGFFFISASEELIAAIQEDIRQAKEHLERAENAAFQASAFFTAA
jgi:hypothetical protein